MAEGADKDGLVKILQQMNDMRKTHHDIVIYVGGQAFPCHRHVVAAACPSLQPLLLKHEWGCENPTLHDIDPKIFEIILEYVYTGVIPITVMNGFRLLKTANYLLMDTLVKKCKEFLSKTCSPMDSILVYEFACSVLNDSQFKSSLEKQMARDLSLIYDLKDFTRISFATLDAVLKVKRQIIETEGDSYSKMVQNGGFVKVKKKSHKAESFSAILNWTKADVVQRIQYLPQLYCHTDLPSQVTKGLEVLLTSYCTEMNKNVAKDVRVNAAELNNKSVNVHTINYNKINTFETFDLKDWSCVNDFDICASNLRTIVKNKQFFYLAYNALKSENYFWTGTAKNIENLCPPPFYASDFELISTNDVIYLLNSSETIQLRSNVEPKIEFSNLNAFIKDWDEWLRLPSSPNMLYHSYFTSLNSSIYVIGGNSSYSMEGPEHSIIQQYDPRMSKWLEIASDVKFGLRGGICAHNERIYICEKGDVSVNNNDTSNQSVLSLRIFDIKTNKWESVSQQNNFNFFPAVLLPHQNTLLCFSHDPSKGVIVYDCDRRVWNDEPQKLPEELCDNKTCEIKDASVI